MKINNRRYIGSKTSLLRVIDEVVRDNYGEGDAKFADLFSGTGVVANHFALKGYDVIANDILYSNYVAYKTWLSNDVVDVDKITEIINYFNNINSNDIESNYFSKIYGGKYFHEDDAKKIGYIRDEIEKRRSNFSEREYFSILSSLLYAADKIANTVGHFEHFLSKKPEFRDFKMRVPEYDDFESSFELYQKDVNELASKIEADIVYLDPPYNARQYVNFYHVLENLANWDKPTVFEGTSMKFKRNHLKSEYSRVKAPLVFEDLISNLKCKLIIVSYNNTYKAKSSASNNKISEKQMMEILSKKGEVKIIEISHKYFNAGKTNFNNHKELIYICKVR